MKKNFLIIFLAIFNLWFLISFFLNKEISSNNQSRNIKRIFPDECIDEMVFSYLDSFFFEDREFIISENANKQLVELFSQGNRKKLFFRLDFPYCDNCIYPVIHYLSRSNSISKDDIWVLSTFPSEEFTYEFKEFISDKNLNVLNIPDFDFTLSLTGLYDPFLFVMGEELKPDKIMFVTQCNNIMIEESLRYYEKYIYN